jgi:hypothetical protein
MRLEPENKWTCLRVERGSGEHLVSPAALPHLWGEGETWWHAKSHRRAAYIEQLIFALMCGPTCLGFSYSRPSGTWKYWMKNFRNKQFLSLKSCCVWSSMAKSQPILLHPTGDLDHLCSKHPHCIYCMPTSSHQLWQYHSVRVPEALILVNNGPQVQK